MRIQNSLLCELKQRKSFEDTTPRGRLLAVIEILRHFTDEKHGLSASEVARCVGVLTGKEPSENTVLSDLHVIAAMQPFDMKISIPAHGENRGFRCIQKHLTSEEAILAGDIVRASAFIDDDTKAGLSRRLYNLSSQERFDKALETVYVDERDGYKSSGILETINTISEAICSEKQVSFRIRGHLMNGKEFLSCVYREDPVAIIFSFGRYYLETVGSSQDEGLSTPFFRRIDYLCEAEVSSNDLAHPEMTEGLRRTVVRDTRERIDMFGDGVTRSLFLRVDGTAAKYIYDRFGHNMSFAHIEENDARATGYAHVKAQLSPTFYRWLFGHSDSIMLAKPPSRRWANAFQGVCCTTNEEFKCLVRDYEVSYEGYSAALKKALRQCETEEETCR